MTMHICPLSECPDTIPTLATWHHDQWAYLNPQRSLAERIQRMQTHLNDDALPSTWVMLDDQQQPLGSAALIGSDMDTRQDLSPWLASVFVHSHYRKKGIGRLLVQEVMKAASALSYERLYLFTPDQAHFYKNMAWEHLESCVYRDTQVDIMCYRVSK